MFYLIEKSTGKVIEENEKKSIVRKKQRSMKERDDYKVSRTKNHEAEDQQELEKENSPDVVDLARTGNIEEFRIKQSLESRYPLHTQLFQTEDELRSYLTKNDIFDFKITRHKNRMFYAYHEKGTKQ